MQKRKYTVVIEKDEDGIYIASVPALPGCHSYGETIDELMKNMKEAIELYIEVLESEKQKVQKCARLLQNWDFIKNARKAVILFGRILMVELLLYQYIQAKICR